MQYELRTDEFTWQRGVWFRRTGIVPYNRITNIDIRQGPLMPEIVLEAVEHAEELRGTIRSRVRLEAGEDGTGSGTPDPRSDPHATDLMILDELR